MDLNFQLAKIFFLLGNLASRMKNFLLRIFLPQRAKTAPKVFFLGEKLPETSENEIWDKAKQCFKETADRLEFLSQSKLGSKSWKIFFSKITVKAVALSEKKAEEVERAVAILKQNKILLVPFLGKSGNVVFLQWVSGRHLSLLQRVHRLEEMARIQASIHSCSLSGLEIKNQNKNSLYLDFLARRFIYFASLENLEKEAEEIIGKLVQNKPQLSLALVCPDFTDNNLLLNGNGRLLLIDVETLGFDFGREFDILNTAYFLFPRSRFLQARYLACYEKYHSLGALRGSLDFWENFYRVRLAGSFFGAGKINQGKKIFRELQKKL